MATFALSGSGTMASVWAQALAQVDGHRLIAVASRRWEHAARFANAHAVQPILPRDLPGGADLVIVASAPAAHVDDALDAARAGAGVLVEAPLCTTLADADRLVAAVDAGGRIAYAENLLFAPLVRDALRRVHTLGPLRYLEARVEQQRPVRRTRLDAGWGGGILFDLGVHAVAVVLAMAGQDPVVEVQAQLWAMAPDGDAVDDRASVTLRFKSGATGSLALSWRAQQPQWDLQVAAAHSALRMELLPDPHLEQLGVDLPLPARRHPGVEPAQLDVFGYASQLEELGAELTGGRAPYVNVRFGRYVLDVVCAAHHAARVGRPEPVPFRGLRTRTPWQLWRSGGPGSA